MSSAGNAKYMALARALPERLKVFLARYPPGSIVSPTGSNTSCVPAPAPTSTDNESQEQQQQQNSQPQLTRYQQERPNPFIPVLNAATGKWQDPLYSLRRQAELVKMAREHGVEELLPETRKGTLTRVERRVRSGLKVKGTGRGKRVKGHKFERVVEQKYDFLFFFFFPNFYADTANQNGQDGQETRGCCGNLRHGQRMAACKSLSLSLSFFSLFFLFWMLMFLAIHIPSLCAVDTPSTH